MKSYLIIFAILFLCISESFCQEKTSKMEISKKNDTIEYQLIIIDNGFDLWLHTRAKPKEYFAQSYYENWNKLYVSEWNKRFNAGKNSDIIESYVDYDSGTDYGLELNYKLYNYFLYFEETNNVVLIHRHGK